MENFNNFSEDDNKIFSLSDKMTFASSGITSFQISEPQNKKKTCRCCVWSVFIIYLVMLTGGMGFLAYEVYTMHKFINNMKEAREAMIMNHLVNNVTMENEIFFGINAQSGQENWIHNLKHEIHVMKLSNQHLQWEMANITDQIKSNMTQGGPPGPKGERGVPGIKGDQGFSGLDGEKGSKGDLGPAGLKGEPGMKGEMGEMGPRGLPGSKGEPGERGITGPRGLTGPPGEKGEKGNQGQEGQPGHSGLPGPQGNKGAAGNVGPPGAPGPKGEKGEAGAVSQVPGPRGQKGDQGQKGSKGDTGSRGAQGSKGERGISGFGAFLRLVGQDNRGRVEILHKGQWGTICDDHWNVNSGNVICRMLGFSRAVNVFTAPEGSGQIWLDDVQCSGNEISIYLCNKREWGENNCSHSEDAGVECA
ncbi:macrophage receptor MARCO isoform X2 [Pseudonaja textilis]|uniref:macrophage receptor MARCO isoform X2 n=1 Tax=Pseudonaja textilis TaxID=8673 RepID=UPI000EA93A15|nr:macrophage receptor MARCO isoform X2 [Pseudonaja textilis]